MMKIRKAEERGSSDLGWLKSWHTFSFGPYYDPQYVGLGPLRVLNDDRVAPGAGFGTHPHANMEIVSYVLEGVLEHKDSMGNGSRIRAGDVQRLSAGSGITHSEYNPSSREDVHFLQIWVVPNRFDISPGYDQKSFADHEKRGVFRLIASEDGRNGSIRLHQSIDMSVALMGHSDDAVQYSILEGRMVWVHLARGTVVLNKHPLKAGDGVAFIHPENICFEDGYDAELLVFDMKVP